MSRMCSQSFVSLANGSAKGRKMVRTQTQKTAAAKANNNLMNSGF